MEEFHGPSILPGAFVKTAKGNEFTNVGGNMFKINFNIDHLVANPGGGEESRGEERTQMNLGSESLTTSTGWVYAVILKSLQAIFGPGQSSPASESPPRDMTPGAAEATQDPDSIPAPTSTVMDIMQSDATTTLSSSGTLRTAACAVLPLCLTSSTTARYLTSMLSLQQGYPLYEPGPEEGIPTDYWRNGVRVGDVGLVMQDGAFDFLFNVCPSEDEVVNPPELPEDFEALQSPDIMFRKHFPRQTHLFSTGVTQTEAHPVAYRCLLPEGAVLELPSGATRFEAKNKVIFRDLAARHAEKWYKYAVISRGRDAANGSLYLVTACIKCKDWGMAVFERPSEPQDFLRFVSDEERGRGALSTHNWEVLGAVQTKIGPELDDMNTRAAEGQEVNQCVFLRGYKIMLQQDAWTNLAFGSGISETHDLGPSPPQGQNGTTDEKNAGNQTKFNSGTGSDFQHSLEMNSLNLSKVTIQDSLSRSVALSSSAGYSKHGVGRVIVEEDFGATFSVHPSDLVNTVLLERKTAARLALTHDDEWCELLRKDVSLAHNMSSFSSFVDQYGCISLVRVVNLNSTKDLTASISARDWDPNVFICFTTAARPNEDIGPLMWDQKKTFYYAAIDLASAFMRMGSLHLPPTSFGGIQLCPPIVSPLRAYKSSPLVVYGIGNPPIQGRSLEWSQKPLDNLHAREMDVQVPGEAPSSQTVLSGDHAALAATKANITLDDTSVSPLPCGHVDYFSHKWQEEEIWHSWQKMTRGNSEISNAARLENASWRVWWKKRNKLGTVAPETLNWMKDSDVTWLYGPLYTAADWALSTEPKSDDSGLPPTRAGAHRARSKPILKHRTLGGLLTHELRPRPAFTSVDMDRGGQRLPNETQTVYNSDDVDHEDVRPPARYGATMRENGPGLVENSTRKKKKHISFNAFVDQFIVVEPSGLLEDVLEDWGLSGSDHDDDDGYEEDESDNDDDDDDEILEGSAITDGGSAEHRLLEEGGGGDEGDEGDNEYRPKSNNKAKKITLKRRVRLWSMSSTSTSPSSTPFSGASRSRSSSFSTSISSVSDDSDLPSPSSHIRKEPGPLPQSSTRILSRRSSIDGTPGLWPRQRVASQDEFIPGWNEFEYHRTKGALYVNATIAPLAPTFLKTTEGAIWKD